MNHFFISEMHTINKPGLVQGHQRSNPAVSPEGNQIQKRYSEKIPQEFTQGHILRSFGIPGLQMPWRQGAPLASSDNSSTFCTEKKLPPIVSSSYC